MIGLDTSVLVRYLVGDDPLQTPAATAIIDELDETSQGFVSLVTVVETSWVLRRAYGVSRTRTHEILAGLLEARELHVEAAALVRAGLDLAGNDAEFADAVIAAAGAAAGCLHTYTFDRRAAANGLMTLLETR